jgi:hypothetical protein
MRSRSYTKEVGIVSAERPPVPAAIAFVVLAVVALAAILFVREVLASPPAHQAAAVDAGPVKVSSR